MHVGPAPPPPASKASVPATAASAGRGKWRRLWLSILGLPLVLLVVISYFLLTMGRLPQRGIRLLRLTAQAPLLRTGICLCRPDREIEFRREDGLKIAGSLYGEVNLRGPDVALLLHGNTPVGRRLPIYRVLATRLAERGFAVVSIDFTGYGQSDDPFSPETREIPDRAEDVLATLDFLDSLRSGALEGVALIGHSGGVPPAMTAAIEDPRVASLVAIGPPRGRARRMMEESAVAYFWERARRTHRAVYGHPLPDWFTREIWLEDRLRQDIERQVEYFATENHKPLLLMDGELESQEDRDYLAAYFSRTTPPSAYATIPSSDHYGNTDGLLGIVLYDMEVVERMVNRMVDWLRDSGDSAVGP